jgi:glycosyltransferase involved in cell wall biosynthesis
MNHKAPKISVITVTLNASLDLQKTLDSITMQDYPDLEIIVIDGGSEDGTVEVISAYADHIAYWISEPDKGIYDAMNKGLSRATGEWVNFMNAGDLFFNSEVVSSVFNREITEEQVIYGDSVASYPAFKAWRKALLPDDLRKGMICCHQSMFFRTDMIGKEAYRPDLYFSADFEMIYRLYRAGKIFRYIPISVAVFSTRGTSNLHMVKSARSNFEILSAGGVLSCQQKRYHRRVILQALVTECMYKFLPSFALNFLLKRIYRHQRISESGEI